MGVLEKSFAFFSYTSKCSCSWGEHLHSALSFEDDDSLGWWVGEFFCTFFWHNVRSIAQHTVVFLHQSARCLRHSLHLQDKQSFTTKAMQAANHSIGGVAATVALDNDASTTSATINRFQDTFALVVNDALHLVFLMWMSSLVVRLLYWTKYLFVHTPEYTRHKNRMDGIDKAKQHAKKEQYREALEVLTAQVLDREEEHKDEHHQLFFTRDYIVQGYYLRVRRTFFGWLWMWIHLLMLMQVLVRVVPLLLGYNLRDCSFQ